MRVLAITTLTTSLNMGWRFRRSIKILPGIRLNLSRSGVSASVGVRGAHITVGHGKVRETVGVPGTGISYTETQSTRQPHHPEALELEEQPLSIDPKPQQAPPFNFVPWFTVLIAIGFIVFLVHVAHNRCRISCDWTHLISSEWDHPISG